MNSESRCASQAFSSEQAETDPLLARHQAEPIKSSSRLKFRFIICGLLVWGTFIKNYERHVLSVASIKMVSSDVVARELTDLRAALLASQLFEIDSSDSNVALPGTCPLYIQTDGEPKEERAKLSRKTNETLATVSQIALDRGVSNILDNLHMRLSQGKLVDWSTQQRGFILASAPIGSLLAALPLSRLGLMIGSKHIITLAFTTCALHALLLPLIVVRLPFWLIITCELIFGGLSDGATAVINPFFANWLTHAELGAFTVIYMFALSASSSTNSFLSTQLLAANVPWNWCMYLPGIIMLITLVAWLALASERPGENSRVSNDEIWYLKQNSAVQKARQQELSVVRDMTSLMSSSYQCICKFDEDLDCPALRLIRTPIWSTFLSSPSIYAQIFANFAYYWKTELWSLWPIFFANILHLDPGTIGIMISLKAFVAFVYGVAFARLARRFELRRPFGWELLTYRRVNYLLAAMVAIASSILMVVFDCSPTAMVLSVLLTPLLNGFVSVSYLRLPVDQSPEDSGVIASYVRLFSPGDTLAIPISSYVLSLATQSSSMGDRTTWRVVWSLAAAIDLLAAIVFLILARTDRKVYSKLRLGGCCKSQIMDCSEEHA